jgi:hypothetical protein
MLTGRTAAHLGYPFPMPEGGGLAAEFKTVAHELKSKGYRTAFVVSCSPSLPPLLLVLPFLLPSYLPPHLFPFRPSFLCSFLLPFVPSAKTNTTTPTPDALKINQGKWGVDFPPGHPEISEEQAKASSAAKLARVNGLGSAKGQGPLERGFDSFMGFYESAHDHFTKHIDSPYHSRGSFIDWHRHNSTHVLDYPDVEEESGQYSSHLFTEEALNIIRTTWTADKPSFLHLSYSAAHTPLQVNCIRNQLVKVCVVI